MSSTGIRGPAFYLYFVLWGWGVTENQESSFRCWTSWASTAFGEGDRVPSPLEERTVESLGWTASAQTGQGLVPSWWLTSSQELLPETLLATFSLVVEGEGF